MSLRILHICGTAEGGRWLLDQVVELAARGHEVEIVVPGTGTLTETLTERGFTVHVIPFRGYRPAAWGRLAKAQLTLTRLIRRGGFDVIHAHLFKSIVSARVACAIGSSPPLVSQIAGVVHLESKPLNAIDLLTSTFDDALVASCTNFADIYRARGAKNVHVSHYGCHVEDFSPAPELRAKARQSLGLGDHAYAVAMIAHMYPSTFKSFREVGVKGHETFIDAAARIRNVDNGIHFYVVGDEFVGDGSYRRRLEHRAEDLGLGGSMSFLGHRSDVRNLLAGMDLLVNPSLSESASYTMIEASLMEKPVVATRVGGLTDTVLDGVTGELIPPRDDMALAEAIESLARDRDRGHAYGRRGREHVNALFDIRSTVTSLEAVYDELVGARD